MKRDQSTTILTFLFFSIAIMLSCSVFAKKPGPPPTYVIGDTGPGGGIIFHVSNDGSHGLEAAQKDQAIGTPFPWDDGSGSDGSGSIRTNAAKSGINDGSFNTDRIISRIGFHANAAIICSNYNGGGYGDWYLPSRYELNLMYINLHQHGLGSFAEVGYWSSTEHSLFKEQAEAQLFKNGVQFGDDKSAGNNIRAIRAF